MAAAPTKNQKIEALVKLVQKRSRGAGLTTTTPQRTVLETLMYAALLENAPFDKADIAMTVLENYYIDWNEIRVCSVRELADTLTDLPHPEAAAERIRGALQGIFEKKYVFDLEDFRKKGKALAEHVKILEGMSAGTPYMIQYVAQVALDGHLIPMDEASLRIMRRLGLSQVSSDGTQEICTGLDRVILKKQGLSFATQLHHFAVGYYDVPDDPELLSLLSKIDSEAVNRSWASPVLSPLPSAQPPKPSVIPLPDPKSVPPIANTSAISPKVSAQTAAVSKVAKPASKPLPAKPVKKKPLPAKSNAKTPKKLVKSVVTKKSPARLAKAPPSKKNVLSKKPLVPSRPKQKVKAVVKKGRAKPVKKSLPVKKPKSVSPSKSLRKRKPK